jgi:transcriptional regulator with XRE-family HTH domain
MTQKELAELCNVDIRTIQRIEAGAVEPRMYTLKLLSSALGFELSHFPAPAEKNATMNGNSIKLAFIAGLVFSINAIPLVFYMVTGSINSFVYPLTVTVQIASSILFFRGFYLLGKQYGNMVINVSALLSMVLLPLLNLTEVLKYFLPRMYYHTPAPIVSVIFTLLCINAIIFGLGLLAEAKRRYRQGWISTYAIAGFLTLIQSVLFISINLTLAGIGLLISIGTDILLTVILYREYKHPGCGYTKSSEGALAW